MRLVDWLARALGAASAASFALGGLDFVRGTTRVAIVMWPFARVEVLVFAACGVAVGGSVAAGARGQRTIATLFATAMFFGLDALLGLFPLSLGSTWARIAVILVAAAGVVEIRRSPARSRRLLAAAVGAMVGALSLIILVVVLIALGGSPP